jgi:hypothetical protein
MAAEETKLVVSPSAQSLSVGDTFTVDVTITGNPGFSAVQFTLTFDDTVVDCTRAALGSMLEGTFAAANPNASEGAIIAAASIQSISGDGPLASFTFQVIGEGDADFGLENTILCDASGSQLSYTVTGVDRVSQSTSGTNAEGHPGNTSSTAGSSSSSSNSSGISASNSGGSSSGSTQTAPVTSVPETTEAAAPEFLDMTGHWAQTFVRTAVQKDLMQGYADGTFLPDKPVTRSELVSILWHMSGEPTPSGASPFADTSDLSDKVQSAIAWAYEQKLVSGRTAEIFSPNDCVTRQEAIKILHLYAGGESGAEGMFTQIYDDAFTDSAAIPLWAKPSMYWGVYHGLLSGTSPTTLSGSGLILRGQMATILVRYADEWTVK